MRRALPHDRPNMRRALQRWHASRRRGLRVRRATRTAAVVPQGISSVEAVADASVETTRARTGAARPRRRAARPSKGTAPWPPGSEGPHETSSYSTTRRGTASRSSSTSARTRARPMFAPTRAGRGLRDHEAIVQSRRRVGGDDTDMASLKPPVGADPGGVALALFWPRPVFLSAAGAVLGIRRRSRLNLPSSLRQIVPR